MAVQALHNVKIIIDIISKNESQDLRTDLGILNSAVTMSNISAGCSNLRGFFVVTLIAGRKGPVPAVLKVLTVKKNCVFPVKPFTVTEVWFQGTLTFPMVSGLVSSSQ